MKKILFIVAILTISAIGANAQKSYTVEQICDSALRNNIAIRTAQHNIEAAKLQRKEAFTKYFPDVSATGIMFNSSKSMMQMTLDPSSMISPELGMALAQSFPPEALASLASPVDISMMKSGTIASVMAVQPVFAGGQIINGNRLAKVGVDVSHLQLEISKNEVEKTAEQYFWQLATLQEKLKTVQAVETLLNDIYKDVDVAVKAGVAIRNDLLQVQLRQNDVASQKLKLNNGISLVRMLLCQYCGIRDTSFVISYKTDVVPPMAVKQDHHLAVLNTAEYKLLDKQVEATALQEKMAWGKNLPTVAVGAGYNFHNLLDKNQSFGMVFATVNIPISGWWGGTHAVNRSKLDHIKAQDQLANNTDLLIIRMQNAWNGVEEAYSQLQLAQLSIEQATENLRVNRDYYNAGMSKMSDLLAAQLLYQQACDKRTDAFAEYQNKLLEYKQAIGE